MANQNWRTGTDAEDYFGHQKKQLEMADRRPVIRKASDLVGPGVGANAVPITNFNDLLATFDGFFASAPGAVNAPNDTDAFVGLISSDSTLGGTQVFSSLADGRVWTRVFTRSSLDPSAILWGSWRADLSERVDDLETLVDTMGSEIDTLNEEMDLRNPLYTGTLDFFMTSAPAGSDFYGTAAFGHTFPSPPVCWAIRVSTPAGSARTIVSVVDTITTTSCRIGVLNTGPADATFTDMTVRWFAQMPSN